MNSVVFISYQVWPPQLVTPRIRHYGNSRTSPESHRRCSWNRSSRAVSVKLPPFWPEKSTLQFAQAEAQFTIKGITAEKTMCAYVVSMLDDKTAAHAMDIFEEPLAEQPYTTLKARLTKAYAITDSEKAERLLNMTGLGDQTTSQCLTNMLMLVPKGQYPVFLFRQLFLRQLPSEVWTQLAQTTKIGTKAADLRELALEADKYFMSTGSKISAISEALTVDDDLNVNAVTGRSSVCFYHAKFGNKATKYWQPCNFQTPSRSGTNSKNTTSNQGNFRSGRGFLH